MYRSISEYKSSIFNLSFLHGFFSVVFMQQKREEMLKLDPSNYI